MSYFILTSTKIDIKILVKFLATYINKLSLNKRPFKQEPQSLTNSKVPLSQEDNENRLQKQTFGYRFCLRILFGK